MNIRESCVFSDPHIPTFGAMTFANLEGIYRITSMFRNLQPIRRVHSPCSFPRPGFWVLYSGFCLSRNSFWMIHQLMKCLKRCKQYIVCFQLQNILSVCLSLPVMTYSAASGHDFRYHFRSWLPVPIPVMTSGTASGHDFRCHFRSRLLVPLPVMSSGTPSGHVFRYHFRPWLLVPHIPDFAWIPHALPLMTSGTTYGYDSVMARTTSGTISGHDFWQYHVALNCCILDCIKNSVSQSS